MSQALRILALAMMLAAALAAPTSAAEREQVRMVINLVAGVKMPFPRLFPPHRINTSCAMVGRMPTLSVLTRTSNGARFSSMLPLQS